MPVTEFSELSELTPDAPSGNGHAADEGSRQILPSFGRAVRMRAPDIGFSGGRGVDPRGNKVWGFNTWDIEKRPYGREDNTIGALRAIRDFDPQASQATSNYLRLMNPGHELVAVSGIGEAEQPVSGKAQAILDELAERVGEEYGGGLDQFHNVLALMLITQGAIAAEMAPWPDLSEVEDWYPVNPLLLSYKRMPLYEDDKVGKLILGQRFADGKWVAVNANQVFHQPLDPDVNEPYGRPPFMAALQTVLSKSMMLNDLRAVAHNQGYPRLDIKVLWDELLKAAPPTLRDGGQDRQLIQWMQSQLTEIVSSYNDLKVDDTYVHYDWVDVGMVGPNYAATSFDFKGLEAILSRQINSALKSLPILLGYNETTSETHGSIQWQIQVAYIMSLRRLTKRLIEKLGTASLRLMGEQARAKLTYKEIRTVDRKFEAESEFLEAKTRQIYQLQGWRDGDDISQELFGEDAKADPVVPGATGKEPLGTGGSTDSEGNDNGDQVARGADIIATLLRESPARLLRIRAIDDTGELVERFAMAGGVIFQQAKADLIEVLRAEGFLSDEARDTNRDIADYVFGLRYARQMKALLRAAIKEGMAQSGVSDPQVPESLVDRIWNGNRQFVDRIKNDLKAALRAGSFRTIADIDAWFRREDYREVLMGRFLARQGITGGYAYGVRTANSAARFTWVLGDAQHCGDCQERDGTVYSYEELLSVGFPGSINLECAANCKCSLIEEG